MSNNKTISNKYEQVHERYHKKTKPVHRLIKENNFTYRLLLKQINKRLKNSNLKILDIGCGAGTLAFYLASRGHSVTGIDISQRAIQSCRDTAKNLNLKINFIKLDFTNDTLIDKYDFIIFSEVIEHLPKDRDALERINNLLNKNGLLLLSTPSINAPLYRAGFASKFDKQVGHLRRYSKKEICKLIRSANFKILEVNETEGIIRNFLFVNPQAGKFLKFVKFFVSDFVTFLDNISLRIFGESNYIIIARKV